MRRIIIIAALILMMGHVVMAAEIKNYYLHMSKDKQKAANLHVTCSFALDFQDKDSVSMNIGGGQEFSIDNLRIDTNRFDILSQSLPMAFMRNEANQRTDASIPGKLSIYQIKNMQCGKERYGELLEMTEAAITFFGRVYGENYISEKRNVTALPVYLLRNGEGLSNKYNIGFISASQEKFSTKPDIYPLIHEIGPYYETQLDWCRSEYEKIKGTPLDKPIVYVVTNNNNTVVYRKGPLTLIRIAEQIGYGELMSVISGFYKEYAGKYPLKYTDFIDMVNESHAGVGDQLDLLLTAQSL